MSSIHSVKFELASRYGLALFEIASEKQELDKVEKDLKSFAQMCEESADLRFMLNCPTIPKSEKVSALMALADKADFSKTTKDFLGIVADNNRLFALSDMVKSFLELIEKSRGGLTAEVISAQALTAEQNQGVKDTLAKVFGKTIELKVRLDERLLGGMMVKVGSLLIDSSLRTKVQQLKLAMKGA